MKLIPRFFAILLFIMYCMSNTAFAEEQNDGDQIIGFWLNEEKDAKIEIYKYKDLYFGKIVWLKTPNRDGKPKLDRENDDPKLQKRPIMGLKLLKNFVYAGDNEWEDGKIYDPKSGNTYSCNIELQEDGKTLDVRGYIGISLFGRTTVWTRAD